MVVRSDWRLGPSAVESCAASATAAMASAAESLQARLELVLDERLGALPPEVRGFLQVARKDGLRLLKLIGDLREIALAESDRLELDWSRFDLADAVHEAIVPVGPRAVTLGKDIVVNVPQAVAVDADAARVKAAVLRLVQQAVQISAPGSVIEIDLADAEVRLRYEADNPPPEDSLALAHALSIAHAHGGSLDVVADERGVELTLTLAAREPVLRAVAAA
jgi:signal transduction histidine kinase